MRQLSGKAVENKPKNIRAATRPLCRASKRELTGRMRAVLRAGMPGGVHAGVRIDGEACE